MHILYLSYDGMTDPLGQSQVIPYLQGLSKEGYRFTIISFEKLETFQKRKESIATILKQASIHWLPQIYHKSPPILSTLYDIKIMQNISIELYKKKPFDIVHCRSYVSSLVGLSLKKNLEVKFIFDMRGFWPDERVDGKIWNISNPLFKAVYTYFKKKEKEFISNADYIISLTHNAKKEIHSWKHIQNQALPIEVIPCCADLNYYSTNNIDNKLINKFREQLNIREPDFILSYLGTVGSWYMLEEMLQFFNRLLIKRPNSKFLFITPDNPKLIFEKAGQLNMDIKNLIIYSANRNEVPSLLSLSNLAIFFIKPVYSKKASSPTKHGEIMGMGIPLICNDGVGDVGDIMRSSKTGSLVTKYTNDEYDKIIDNLDFILKISREQIQNAAHEFYSLEKGISKYKSVYQALLPI